MFDPTIGRWQSKDPKSFDAGDTNLYRFVGNHPSYATDPSGLEEWDPKKLSRAFIDKLIAAGAEMRVHLGSADDKHLTVSYRYIDPETGDERVAIFRDRTTTSWMIWSNTHWELMGTSPLRNMSMEQAFETIHDSPLSVKSHNDAVAFMQAIPLVRTADSISQGKVIESGLNLGNDVIDVVSLGGTAAVRTAGTETIKWTGRSVLAGQWGYGAYEAYAEGDTSRLKGAAISSVLYAMAGVKNGSNGSLSAPKGLTALGGSPNRIAASSSQIESLVGQIKSVAQSSTFVRRAKALGFTDEHLAQIAGRIDALHASGNIGFIRSGGWIDDTQFLIGCSSAFRNGRIRHELGHLLDDIRSPGLLAEASSSRLSTLRIFGHEMTAFGTQVGRFNPIRPYGSLLTGIHNNYGYVGSVPFIGGSIYVGWFVSNEISEWVWGN